MVQVSDQRNHRKYLCNSNFRRTEWVNKDSEPTIDGEFLYEILYSQTNSRTIESFRNITELASGWAPSEGEMAYLWRVLPPRGTCDRQNWGKYKSVKRAQLISTVWRRCLEKYDLQRRISPDAYAGRCCVMTSYYYRLPAWKGKLQWHISL